MKKPLGLILGGVIFHYYRKVSEIGAIPKGAILLMSIDGETDAPNGWERLYHGVGEGLVGG
ncbi:hypothetical protein LCGC14_1393640 [marine sediment metagenome]|uniref:Uncharacterized protein n=1 Tax=marine sediment metagenome TaxID=412755 RepID=A0A0F9JZ71_9ZZZZ